MKLWRSVGVGVLAGMLAGGCGWAQVAGEMHRGTNTFPWMYRARSVDGKGEVFVTEGTFPNMAAYTAERLSTLRAMGFDFLRMQVEPTPWLVTADAGERAKFTAQLMTAVRTAHGAGLRVIVAPFPREVIPQWSADSILKSAEKTRLWGGMLVEMAGALAAEKNAGDVLETMNEPSGGYNAKDEHRWADLQAGYVKAVRKVAPTLTVLVTGDRGGGVDGLLRLDPGPVEDAHVLYTFHYYDPMVMTHQGAKSATKKYRPLLSGITYPPVGSEEAGTLERTHAAVTANVADPAEAAKAWSEAEGLIRQYYETPQGKAKIDADLAKVKVWAKSHHIAPGRLVLGEFGVLRPGASVETGAAWTRDVRMAAEREGFAWCFFDYAPKSEKPDMNLTQVTGATPDAFSPEIVVTGLGLKMP